VIRSSKKRIALVVALALAAALALTAVSVSAPQAIESKQAEAEQVLAQIQQIDAELEHVVDDYNAATDRLAALQQELATARHHLDLAKQSNQVAQQTLQERLVALYQNGADESILEVVLGASSLDELLDRVDAANRVSDQDAEIVEDVQAAKTALRKQEQQIAAALAEQEQVVAQRAATKEAIEGQLAERQRLYNSIKDQIVQLEAEERERQARLVEEARRRLEAEAEAAAAGETGGAAPADGGGASATPAAAPSDSSIPAAPPSQYGGVVGIAMQYLGTPYVWAGASPSGFDCSGFIMYVYAQVGVSLPHNAAAQYGYGVPVSRDALQAGDLVFFNGLGHAGIYIGGGQFIHSPHTGDVVKISSIYDSWYASTWVGARRIL
jgi:cell wall-associated NlpC family hydrolase